MLTADLILVGGGLSAGLIGWKLKELRPEIKFLIIEKEGKLGGEHTWSFHASDLTIDQLNGIRPILSASWPTYRAIFPEYTREMGGGYHSVRSQDFHDTLYPLLKESLLLNEEVVSMSASEVTLGSGECIKAECVIDARGFREIPKMVAGYQKFLGLDITLEAPHGEKDPILMDGKAQQKEGLRFFYTLPWSEHTIQVGEARYTESPTVDRDDFRAGVMDYIARKGWKIKSIDREEVGVLPAPMDCELEDFLPSGPAIPFAGVRAGLFHATTGYSLPYAVRFAEGLVALPRLSGEAVFEFSRRATYKEFKRGRYFRLLNRMLFRAADPPDRLPMFQLFYRRPEKLIQRFYAGQLRAADYLRIMTGKPPVSLLRAMEVFLGKNRSHA